MTSQEKKNEQLFLRTSFIFNIFHDKWKNWLSHWNINHNHPDKTNCNDQSTTTETTTVIALVWHLRKFRIPYTHVSLRPSSLSGHHVYTRLPACMRAQRESERRTKAVGATMGFRWEERSRSLRADRGRRRGQREERRITGTSGPRGMNQAEQTLNFEIRYRRMKATHRGQRGEYGTW